MTNQSFELKLIKLIDEMFTGYCSDIEDLVRQREKYLNILKEVL